MDGMQFTVIFTESFFALFGLLMIFMGRRSGRLRSYFWVKTIPTELRARVNSAMLRREAIERLPNIAPWCGMCALVASGLIAARMLTPGVADALLMAAFATLLATTFSRIRHATLQRRAAVLAPRTRVTALAVAGYIATAVCMLCVGAAHAVLPWWSDAAVIAVMAFMMYLAYALSALPSLLIGDDIEAETFVDGHVRATRSSMMLYFAMSCAFVYLQFSSVSGDMTVLRLGATVCAAMAWIGYSSWWFISRMKPAGRKADAIQ